MNTFIKTLALRKDKKMRGYGVYLRIVELCNETPDGRLTFSYEELAWDMRERVNFIKAVVEDYGLFHISDGAIMVADAPCAPVTSQPAQYCNANVVPTANTRQIETTQQEEPAQEPESKQENSREPKQQPEGDYTFRACDLIKKPRDYTVYHRLRERWNQIAPEPGRAERSTNPPTSDVYEDLQASLKEFSEEEIARALEIGAKDTSWNWQFKHLLRAKNVRKMLSKVAHKAMVEEEDAYKGLTPSQIELVKYAESQTTYINN